MLSGTPEQLARKYVPMLVVFYTNPTEDLFPLMVLVEIASRAVATCTSSVFCCMHKWWSYTVVYYLHTSSATKCALCLSSL